MEYGISINLMAEWSILYSYATLRESITIIINIIITIMIVIMIIIKIIIITIIIVIMIILIIITIMIKTYALIIIVIDLSN